jgi:hypothetical protein
VEARERRRPPDIHAVSQFAVFHGPAARDNKVMFAPIAPEPEPGSFVCPACGTPRITSAPEACYECGEAMPRYYGRVPGPSPRRQVSFLTNPIWILLGALYLLCLGAALLFVTRVSWAVILLTALALPALLRTMYRSHKQADAGNPYTAAQWFGILIGGLGKIALAALMVALAILCFHM